MDKAKEDFYILNNENNLNEILKYNMLLTQYLIENKFNIQQAECKRNELIQFLYTAAGFYNQAVIPYSKNSIQTQEEIIQNNFYQKISDLLMYYKRAYGFIPQRTQTNDWDFYVAIRTAIIDNTDSINMELNSIINQKKR